MNFDTGFDHLLLESGGKKRIKSFENRISADNEMSFRSCFLVVISAGLENERKMN